MLSWNETRYIDMGKYYGEGVCLSGDSKPTAGIANGSLLMEMDTGKIYMFNETAGEWVEFGS